MSRLTLARCRLAGIVSLISLSVALTGACKDLFKLNFDCNFLSPPRTALSVVPARDSATVGAPRTFQAYSSNCKTTALTSGVAWLVQDTTIATLTASSSGGGATVTGLRPGYVQVVAIWSGLSATGDFFVY